ncbi:hypothetical protein B5S28_g4693 [[Candida] boidinii]|nr:hypothetical protein B5S28_g4693 [[Candida] boidinii]OWB80852.1 hypothetical protein B5S32_g5167 [[Candida] boidinii]
MSSQEVKQSDLESENIKKVEEKVEENEQQDSSYEGPTIFRKFVYDLILWVFLIVFDCFFREIRPRGAFRLPKKGPIIFVAAPHANQFVDPIVLMGQVKHETGLRISFLIADKSHKRKFIGLVSRSQMSIPVIRAQDNLKTQKGTIKLDPNNELHIIGENTQFSKSCEEKGLIALPKSLGTGEIDKILSDTSLYLRKPFRYANEIASLKGKELFSQGATFKTAPKVDQSIVYEKVFEHLSHGHCLGIFPEGGSHDRPDLLPIKAGVAIMALGAMSKNPNCNVKIVPCGMNYFHPNKFRSRAIVEFGKPIEIPKELVNRYNNPETSKDSIRELLDIITKGLKSVTVTCPDYESLICVQMARRLYANNFSSRLSLESIVEMNRRLVRGYLHFKDEPYVINLKKNILEYNDMLKIMRIPDHLVESEQGKSKLSILKLFLINLFKIVVFGSLSLPGAILFSPIFIATKMISDKKRREALAGSTVKIKAIDVIATWKILVSMGLTPLLYIFYSVLGTYIIRKYYYPDYSRFFCFFTFYLISAIITYSALIFGEKGMDFLKSIRPLWLALVDPKGLTDLRLKREQVSLEITEAVNKFGPTLFPKDFNLLEYQEKLEKKKKRKEMSANMNLSNSNISHNNGIIDSSDEEEELKTQELRNRRLLRKQAKKNAIAGIDDSDVKGAPIYGTVPIFSNDHHYAEGISSTGITSSSENELDSSSITSDSENDLDINKNNDNHSKHQKKESLASLIREKMFEENRNKQL